MRTVDQEMDTKELRRLRAEDCYLTRLEEKEAAAEPLIGELMREGKTIYYANRGGKKNYHEGTKSEVIDFLIRNNYV